MNDSILELTLLNNDKSISYLIDTFQENTINSQDVILNIVQSYRDRFKSLNKKVFFLELKKLNIWEWKEEKIIKIKDSTVFLINNNENHFSDEILSNRKIKEIDNILFKI